MKNPVTPCNEETLNSIYQYNDLVEGWHFRHVEISNGVYRVQGVDKDGHSVSRTCIESELQATLEACANDARDIIRQLQEKSN